MALSTIAAVGARHDRNRGTYGQICLIVWAVHQSDP
jgi:hypothetical protein